MKSNKLTKMELYWYIIGGTIGSGLFVLLPFAIGMAGKAAALAVFLGAFVSFFAYAYNVIIASLFPLKGGDYSQVAFVSSPLVGGMYGFTWIISSLMITGYATAAVSYASAIWPWVGEYGTVIAFVIITFFFAVNYFGTKAGAKLQGPMTIVLLTALIAFVVVGLPKVNFNGYFGEGFFMGGFQGFSGALGLTVFVTLGPAITAIGLSSEVENPTKTIPKAVIGGIAIVTLLCTLIVFVACGVLPIEEVAFQDLTVVAAAIFSPALWVVFVVGGAVFALLTSLLGSVTTFRYPFDQLADEGWLPAIFKRKAKNGWPYVSMLTMYILSLIPLFFNISFDKVVSYISLPAYVILIYVNLKCIQLPKQYPEQWKLSCLRMPMPLYYIFCVAGVVCDIYLIYCYCVDFVPTDYIFIAALCVFILVYTYYRIKAKKVSPEYLQQQKDAIAQEILDYVAQQKNS